MKKLLLAFALSLIPLLSVIAQPSPEPPIQPPSDASLVSPETGVDYAPLERLLAQQQWRKANDKTIQLMLKATGRDAVGWIPGDVLAQFPCADMKIIDELWERYSNGHFGLVPQFKIYVETGNRPGKLDAVEKYQAFGDRLGWRKDNDWIIFIENFNYTLDSPVGHLPAPRPQYQITGGRLQYIYLTKRMVECKMVTTPTPASPKK